MGVDIFNQIIRLKEEVNTKIMGMGRKAKNAQRLMDYLYKNPVRNIKTVTLVLKISRPAAHKLINDLVELDLLNEMTKNQRYRKYTFRRYYQLFLQ